MLWGVTRPSPNHNTSPERVLCGTSTHMRQKEVWDGEGAKPQGVWGREFPAGSRGGAPVGRSGGRNPPEAEEFLKELQANFTHYWVVFHVFSPTYAYVFSVLAGIIPLSPLNGETFDTVCPLPLSASRGGICPLCPPPRLRRLCVNSNPNRNVT